MALSTSILTALAVICFLSLSGEARAASFTIVNRCRSKVWVGTLGSTVLGNGGFEVAAGGAVTLGAPSGWHGRFWGRTHCAFDSRGRGSCATGDCGGMLECRGLGGEPPATLAEFSLGPPTDFYDVSLVDGYNLPMSVAPSGGTGGCGDAGCESDVNDICPSQLQMDAHGHVVACRSACSALKEDEYCCTGAFGSPHTCHSSTFSRLFKQACPRAYSYAYDDPTSTFTCSAASYTITFCH